MKHLFNILSIYIISICLLLFIHLSTTSFSATLTYINNLKPSSLSPTKNETLSFEHTYINNNNSAIKKQNFFFDDDINDDNNDGDSDTKIKIEENYVTFLPGYGTVQGTQSVSKMCAVYWGLPYAEANRWEIPTIPNTFVKNNINSTFDATSPGPGCPQTCSIDPLSSLTCPSHDQSEQCLNLNVFVPTLEQKIHLQKKGINTNLLPVLVFIHGGSFTSGYGASNVYNPEYIVSTHGVIAVTINYRLGLLGQLYSPDHNITGNYWLYDQQYAMAWVQTFIAKFGGDPQKITLSGHSAGAVSLFYHQTFPADSIYYSTILPDMQSLLPCDEDYFVQNDIFVNDYDNDDIEITNDDTFDAIKSDPRLIECHHKHFSSPSIAGARLQVQQRTLLRQYLRDLYKIGYNLPSEYIPKDLTRNTTNTFYQQLIASNVNTNLTLGVDELDVLREIYNINILLAISLNDYDENNNDNSINPTTTTTTTTANDDKDGGNDDYYTDDDENTMINWHNSKIDDILQLYKNSSLPMLQLHAQRYPTWSICHRRRISYFTLQRQKCGPQNIEGYFSKMISFSPPMLLPTSTPLNAKSLVQNVLNHTSCLITPSLAPNIPITNGTSIIADDDNDGNNNNNSDSKTSISYDEILRFQHQCLLNLDADTISSNTLLTAVEQHTNPYGSLLQTYDQFGPTTRTILLPRYHYEYLAGPHAVYTHRPIIMGVTKDEANLFVGGSLSHNSWWPMKTDEYIMTASTLRELVPQIFPNNTVYQTARLDDLLTYFGLDIYSDRQNASSFSSLTSSIGISGNSSSSNSNGISISNTSTISSYDQLSHKIYQQQKNDHQQLKLKQRQLASHFSSHLYDILQSDQMNFTTEDISSSNSSEVNITNNLFQQYSNLATAVMFTCPMILGAQFFEFPCNENEVNAPNLVNLPRPITLFPSTQTPTVIITDTVDTSNSFIHFNNNNNNKIHNHFTMLKQMVNQQLLTTAKEIQKKNIASYRYTTQESDENSDSLESNLSADELLYLEEPIGSPSWLYVSSHPLTIYHSLSIFMPKYCENRVCHGYDLFLHFFSLPTLVNSPLLQLLSKQVNLPLYTHAELQLAGQMSQYYANFIFNGDPNIITPALLNELSTPYLTSDSTISPYPQKNEPILTKMPLNWPQNINQDSPSGHGITPHTSWMIWKIASSVNQLDDNDDINYHDGDMIDINGNTYDKFDTNIYTNNSILATNIDDNYNRPACQATTALGANWAFSVPQIYQENGLPVHPLIFSIVALIVAVIVIVVLIFGSIYLLIGHCENPMILSLFTAIEYADEHDNDINNSIQYPQRATSDEYGQNSPRNNQTLQGIQLSELGSTL